MLNNYIFSAKKCSGFIEIYYIFCYNTVCLIEWNRSLQNGQIRDEREAERQASCQEV